MSGMTSMPMTCKLPVDGRRRRDRLIAALAAACSVAMLLLAATGVTAWLQRRSFPVRHARHDDTVLQLQALYRSDMDHAAHAIDQAHGPHASAQVIGGGNDGNRMLKITMHTENTTMELQKPGIYSGQDAQGNPVQLSSEVLLGTDKSITVSLPENHKPFSTDSEKQWQHTLHLDKNRGTKLVCSQVQAVLDDAGDNW